MPTGVEDRDADVWESLLAIADEAGGGVATHRTRGAVALVADSKGSTPSFGVLLLRDLRTIFDTAGVDALASATIV